jgi:hypothetical protein
MTPSILSSKGSRCQRRAEHGVSARQGVVTRDSQKRAKKTPRLARGLTPAAWGLAIRHRRTNARPDERFRRKPSGSHGSISGAERSSTATALTGRPAANDSVPTYRKRGLAGTRGCRLEGLTAERLERSMAQRPGNCPRGISEEGRSSSDKWAASGRSHNDRRRMREPHCQTAPARARPTPNAFSEFSKGNRTPNEFIRNV